MTLDKETAIRKIKEMPMERVLKVLIFMAGMEAENIIDEKSGEEKQRSLMTLGALGLESKELKTG